MTIKNRKKLKEITIKLLKSKSCDSCLHFGRFTTSSNTQKVFMDEWCSSRNINRMPKSRTCKQWKDDGYNF